MFLPPLASSPEWRRPDGHINLPVFRDLYSNDTCTPLWDCVCPDFLMTSGGLCPIGYYCPEGSAKPAACNSGQYCATPGLSAPTGTLVGAHPSLFALRQKLCVLGVCVLGQLGAGYEPPVPLVWSECWECGRGQCCTAAGLSAHIGKFAVHLSLSALNEVLTHTCTCT